ncbi:MAG: hypothetical protein BroJett011_76250 [Chloroflexota bacterium]|nr:MAG: hypothetical protein BroJett011_76250 [Chloroflexota bacterium]
MASMDRRKLQSKFYLMVDHISFASTEIGALTNGRTAVTTWAKDTNVVFVGELRHILIFALMAFDVAAVAVLEQFRLVSERKFQNLLATNDLTIIDLNPTAGEGIVEDEDVLFLENLTNNYRREWDMLSGLIVEDDATGAKEYFSGSTLAALAYGLQYKAAGTAPLYVATNFGFFDISGAGNGLSVVDLLGPSGPVELDKAHVTLGNLVLSAS